MTEINLCKVLPHHSMNRSLGTITAGKDVDRSTMSPHFLINQDILKSDEKNFTFIRVYFAT